MKILNNIIHNSLQIPGWRTNRHIIVVESDDWGSIRMPSVEKREQLRNRGLNIDKCPFSSYDTLASSEDLTNLFEVLSSVKDKNGKSAILTANSVVANPDFDKIKESGFKQYFYEPFTETLKKYPSTHSNSFEMWKQGIAEGIFIPQLHGREHLNVARWMDALRNRDEITMMSFNQGHFGLSNKVTDKLKVRYMDAFGIAAKDSIAAEECIIKEATELFEKLFGFKSTSFIAPCYIWKKELEPVLQKYGIKYLQGLPLQQIPVQDNPPKVKTKYHYMGQRNRSGQIYLTRNCFFEPYKNNDTDACVKECLDRINMAFRWHKPAIISSHRINFIGSLDSDFRDKNLKLFRQLLTAIKKNWPDVEFMSSNQLGDLINYGK